ncbi:MAG: hypothetical protein ACWGMZ_00670 [Thermoguttaceae bacterium]
MALPARVKSIDALQSMSAALECFSDGLHEALDELDMEVRRAVQFLNVDCREYWKMETRRSWDRVTEAKLQLERAMMTRRIAEQRASCMEEKKALAKAKQRLEFAQARVQAIRHWTVVVDRAVNEYMGMRTQVVNWMESDCPRAVAAIGRMVSALEAYVRLQTPADDLAPIIAEAMKSPLEDIEQNGDKPSTGISPTAPNPEPKPRTLP